MKIELRGTAEYWRETLSILTEGAKYPRLRRLGELRGNEYRESGLHLSIICCYEPLWPRQRKLNGRNARRKSQEATRSGTGRRCTLGTDRDDGK